MGLLPEAQERCLGMMNDVQFYDHGRVLSLCRAFDGYFDGALAEVPPSTPYNGAASFCGHCVEAKVWDRSQPAFKIPHGGRQGRLHHLTGRLREGTAAQRHITE